MKGIDDMNIMWKPVVIKGINTNYEVSEYGNVRNIKSNKLLSPYLMKQCGRERVLLYLNGERFYIKIHRLVYEAFFGPIPPNMTVDHIDENKNNNHYTNLRLLTASDNIKSYLMNHPEHGFQKVYSDKVIMQFFQKMKDGMYYKDAAKYYGISNVYAYDLLRGLRRKDLWAMYSPFPITAHRKSYLSPSDQMVAIADIIDGFSTREILFHIDVIYDDKGIDAISKLRKKVGIKDPKYFETSFLNDVDSLIKQGKTNDEIYRIMDIQWNEKISNMMARRRKKCCVPNNNCKVGDPSEIEYIKNMIRNGLTNSQILDNISKDRSSYYINLFGRLRQEIKRANKGSSTIDQL